VEIRRMEDPVLRPVQAKKFLKHHLKKKKKARCWSMSVIPAMVESLIWEDCCPRWSM
jgi:hypothetical protein